MSKLLHLEHVEDYVLDGNFTRAIDVIAESAFRLSRLHDPSKNSHLNFTHKYDGAPAIVFGINPENGKFFIGTKSVFNKRIPKICYGEEDIEMHYGDKRELCEKLKLAFDDLACEFYSFGSYPNGVYQGDIMYFSDSIEYDDRTVFFTPNTITYRANKEGPLGQAILGTAMGLALHTQYIGDTFAALRAVPIADHGAFTSNVVNFISPELNLDNFHLTDIQFNAIGDWIDFAERSYKGQQCDRTIFDRHSKTLKMFINHCVRIGESSPETSMYEVFLKNRNHHALWEEVAKKRVQFSSLFAIHRSLRWSKNVILERLKNTCEYFTEVDGKPVAPEGFVAVYHGVPCKFVNRMEFSRLNFANKRFV
jgi:hypothetical protein